MGKILVIDSGVGGISTLCCIRALLPCEQYIYFADKDFMPYGDKSEKVIRDRIAYICEYFFQTEQIKAVVVACNTATACGIDYLRDKFISTNHHQSQTTPADHHAPLRGSIGGAPLHRRGIFCCPPIINQPSSAAIFVGVEPAIKPAVDELKDGNILVLATESTARHQRFLNLIDMVNSPESLCPVQKKSLWSTPLTTSVQCNEVLVKQHSNHSTSWRRGFSRVILNHPAASRHPSKGGEWREIGGELEGNFLPVNNCKSAYSQKKRLQKKSLQKENSQKESLLYSNKVFSLKYPSKRGNIVLPGKVFLLKYPYQFPSFGGVSPKATGWSIPNRLKILIAPMPTLASLIENNIQSLHKITYQVHDLLAPYKHKKIASVVLGCTHYCFIKDIISEYLNSKTYDGNLGVAKRLYVLLKNNNLIENSGSGGIEFRNKLKS